MTPPWPHYRLKHLARAVVDKATSSDQEGPYVGLESISSWTGKIDVSESEEVEGSIGNRFKSRDILFGKLRPYLAKVAAPEFSGHCSGEALVLRPSSTISTRFLYYRLVESRTIDEVNASTYGAKMPRASWEFIGNLRLAIPDLETQKVVADFLDRETARIDELIEKRTLFAELVLARREAMITKAVVGGSQDGGSWLSNLPDDWKTGRAKFHFCESQERSDTGEEELLSVSHITGVTKRSEKEVYMFLAESNEGYKLVASSDLVINTMWAWMGAMGVSTEHGLISPSYGVYRPISDELRPDFVDMLVRSKPFVAEATRRSKGIHSSRLRLYPDAFLDMLLPIPPLEVQDAMLKKLSERISKEDELLNKNKRADELLHEFRSAIITAAVTGQIDVTSWGKRGETDRRLDKIEEEMASSMAARIEAQA